MIGKTRGSDNDHGQKLPVVILLTLPDLCCRVIAAQFTAGEGGSHARKEMD